MNANLISPIIDATVIAFFIVGGYITFVLSRHNQEKVRDKWQVQMEYRLNRLETLFIRHLDNLHKEPPPREDPIIDMTWQNNDYHPGCGKHLDECLSVSGCENRHNCGFYNKIVVKYKEE